MILIWKREDKDAENLYEQRLPPEVFHREFF